MPAVLTLLGSRTFTGSFGAPRLINRPWRCSTWWTVACRSGSGRAGRSSRPSPREPDAMVAAIPLGLALGVALGALGGGGAVLAVPLLV